MHWWSPPESATSTDGVCRRPRASSWASDLCPAAAAAHGCEVREFTVFPEYPDAWKPSGRHAWLVEFVVPPPDLRAFARTIDSSIQGRNHDYRLHRTGDRQLRTPVVRLVRRGAFYDWMKRRGRLGGQHEVPRIVDREAARALLEPHLQSLE